MKATITLEIVFEESSFDSPGDWDWAELLNLGAGESVTVTSYEEGEE